MPVLHDETLQQLGVDTTRLSPGSNKFVLCRCDRDTCGAVFKRRWRFLINPLWCDDCNNSPEGKKKRADARRKTMLERHGVAGVVQKDDTNDKRRATNMVRYGGPAPLSSADVRARLTETVQQRYGVDSVSQIPGVRAAASATMLERLGVPYAMMSEEVRAKSRAACEERYGVPVITQSEEMKRKAANTMTERYGAPYPGQCEDLMNKARATCIENLGVPYPTQSPEVRKKVTDTMLERYGSVAPAGVYGRTEKEIADLLRSWGLIVETQHVLADGKSIDIWVPAKRIGIEYCGLHWHNEKSAAPRGRDYHAHKMRLVEAEGFRLITIFEDEWLDRRPQVENFLKSALGVNSRHIGARETTATAIDRDTARHFLEENHIQGAVAFVDCAVGLLKAGELLAVMTLGKHHRHGQAGIVLNRLAFKSDVSVAGGASKLLSACVAWARNNGHSLILSWSDNRWSVGNVYERTGFTLTKNLPPDYSYVVLKQAGKRVSKQSQKKTAEDKRLGLTERQSTELRGLAKIWDCGHKRWELKI
jgi:GNAT superfamily N-acetyltransferase